MAKDGRSKKQQGMDAVFNSVSRLSIKYGLTEEDIAVSVAQLIYEKGQASGEENAVAAAEKRAAKAAKAGK
jgi:hypothetical protein